MTASPRICHVAIGHSPLDDRIYYKELGSLRKWYSDIHLIAPALVNATPRCGIRFWLFRPRNWWADLLSAYRLAKQVRADIYHVHEFEFLPLALILKFKYGKTIIYDAHETIYWFLIEFSRRSHWVTTIPALVAQTIEWGCAAFVDRIIAVTPWVARGFRRLGRPARLIYNFPLNGFFQPAEPSNQPPTVILYHGQLVAARRIDIMIRAMEAVVTDFPSAQLHFVGDLRRPYRDELEQLINATGLTGKVLFFPPLGYEQIPALIRSATIGLSSMAPNESFKRSIQIKPLEFMAAGVPVLGCRVPSTEFFIERHRAGILIDPPTPENLAAAIKRLLASPGLRMEMGKNGRQAVATRFHWGRMERRLVQIYRQLTPKLEPHY